MTGHIEPSAGRREGDDRTRRTTMTQAIEVRAPHQDLSRRRRGGEGDRLRRRRRRGVRAARPERRRQVDDDRHADTTIAPTGGTARLAGFDVATRAARGARGRERRVPGGGRRPRAHRPAQPRPPRAALGRRAARGRSRGSQELADAFGLARAARPAGRDLQRRPAPAARDRPRARLRPARAVPRRADRRARPAHPRTSCSTSSPACATATR